MAGRNLSRRKFVILALTPAALLLLASEVGLRLVGFCFNPHDLNRPVFERTDDGMLKTSQVFTDAERFVPSPFCVPQTFPADKRRDTLRVALLGGSCVYLLGTADLLAEQIRSATGGSVVEILNFGILGCGSDRVVVAAREAIQLEADILVVYCGHNTFTSFSDPRCYSVPPFGMRPFVRHSRVLQGAWCLVDHFQRPHKPAVHPGTRNFLAHQKAFTKEEKQQRYREFEHHLREVVGLCRAEQRKLILCTVAYNVVLPPYAHGSRHELSQLKNMSNATLGELHRQDPDDLLVKHELGLRMIAAGDPQTGREWVEQVFLETPRPDRANRQINAIVIRVARDTGVPLADVHQVIERAAPLNLPAGELFTDNCHLNETGNRLLLLELGRRVAELADMGRKPDQIER